MKASIVIGSGFGDEGKGLITDYLVHRVDAKLVVRFNGGAQAGHTVETPDGLRHIFSHFGSGTFLGADTYLASEFVANPILFFKELQQLKELKVYPKQLLVHPDVKITTPWDMMINQFTENHRNEDRHGSCGVGFGETIERHEYGITINVNDCYCDHLITNLDYIRKFWVPKRLEELSIPYTDEMKSLVMSDGIMNQFVKEMRSFGRHILIWDSKVINNYKSVVFEGAQGLALNQYYKHFPHVTRSHTGIKNALDIADEIGLTDVDVHYVTRAYITRHGAGPLEHEVKSFYQDVNEKTNVTNEYQQHFRYGILDVDLLKERIHDDLMSMFKYNVCMNPVIDVTCLDQLSNVQYWHNNELHNCNSNELFDIIAKAVNLQHGLQSWGPTRMTIRERK